MPPTGASPTWTPSCSTSRKSAKKCSLILSIVTTYLSTTKSRCCGSKRKPWLRTITTRKTWRGRQKICKWFHCLTTHLKSRKHQSSKAKSFWPLSARKMQSNGSCTELWNNSSNTTVVVTSIMMALERKLNQTLTSSSDSFRSMRHSLKEFLSKTTSNSYAAKPILLNHRLQRRTEAASLNHSSNLKWLLTNS